MRTAILAALAAVTLAPPAGAEAPFSFLSVGSGELDGGYYRMAQGLCAVVNAAEGRRLRCSPEATQGSRYNIEALMSGELEFALAQSDVAFSALHGASIYAGRPPQLGLRTVAPLYVETVTALARRDSGIAAISDIIGKRVDIGPSASGRNATVKALLGALDMELNAFGETLRMPTSLAVESLCSGRIDAMILVVGHPSATVADALTRCDATLIPFAGPALSQVVAAAPYYTAGVVPAAAYPGLDADVPTIDVTALLLTSLAIPDSIVAAVAGAILNGRARLAEAAPLLTALAEDGAEPSGAPPLHPGAVEALAGLER